MQNKKVMQIIVPALIIVLIAGMYFYKNFWSKPIVENSESSVPVETNTAAVPVETNSPAADSNQEPPAQAGGEAMPLSSEYALEDWLAEGKPLIIEFGTETCVYCQNMAYKLQAMQDKYGDQISIKNVDPTKVDVSNDFPVNYVPAQFFFTADGKPFVPGEANTLPLQQFKLKGSDEHVLTGHVGEIEAGAFEQLVQELIGD